MERYTTMYPRGQPGLPNDLVMAYINNLRTTDAASRTTATQRALTTLPRDPTCECNVCVASASSSSDPEPAPQHRATDAQRRGLNELAKARRQLDKELAILHREVGLGLGVQF
jgi:hypothetical protein